MFLYTLVDDYGYESLMMITAERKLGVWFTHLLIAYWVIVSSVLLLNIFIALMSGGVVFICCCCCCCYLIRLEFNGRSGL